MTLTVARITVSQRRQRRTFGAHVAQVMLWPHGKNMTPTGRSWQRWQVRMFRSRAFSSCSLLCRSLKFPSSPACRPLSKNEHREKSLYNSSRTAIIKYSPFYVSQLDDLWEYNKIWKTELKQEEQMLRWRTFKCTIENKSCYESDTPVTLKEGQGHQTCYDLVDPKESYNKVSKTLLEQCPWKGQRESFWQIRKHVCYLFWTCEKVKNSDTFMILSMYLTILQLWKKKKLNQNMRKSQCQSFQQAQTLDRPKQ